MIIFPAIDIKEGHVVRLLQGRFEDVTEYSQDPLSMAQAWQEEGAPWLHIVDLDGAQTGQMKNFDIIQQIAQELPIPIEMGGGIRSVQDVENLVNAGVSRVILGTKAIEDRSFLEECLKRWSDKIAVSLDCKEGKVAVKGWTEVSSLDVIDFAKELEAMSVSCIVYTNIKNDGMLTGPDLDGLKHILNATTSLKLIASGGIKNMEHIQDLLDMNEKRLLGAITGKALYEGTLNIKEALKRCSQNA